MKKIYLFFALLLAMVGFGVSNALVATVEGEAQDADALEDGMQVFIGNNITNENGAVNQETGEITHTFGNYRCLMDDSNKNGTLAQGQGVTTATAKTTQIWNLVEAKTDANGTWFYLKNGETGRYIGVPAKATYSGETLLTALPMTANEAEAMPFLFKSPAEAWALMGVEETREEVLDLIQTMNENETYPLMILAELDGKIAGINCSGGQNRLSTWKDWAGYWTVIEGECVYDPVTEFEQYMATVTIPTFQFGDYPGCVVEAEEAQATIDRLQWLQATLDDPDAFEEKDFEDFLVEAKALVAKLSKFTFKPMVPGYYRFISAMGAFESTQGVQKAMYAVTGAAKWTTLNEGEEIMVDVTEEVTDPETGETTTEVVGQEGTGERGGMDQVWVVEEKEDAEGVKHLYVKNLKTQQYFANATNQSAAVGMTNTEKWVQFTLLNGDFSLKVEGKGYDLHTGGHASGAGEAGNIVGWNGNSGSASAWIMQPISEEQIQEIWGADAIEKAAIEAEFMATLAEAKALLETSQNSAKPECEIIDPVIDCENKIFTTADNDGTHVTSPCSDQTEGNIDNLLDGIEGDANNFWHSDWHGTYNGTWCNGYHYLQFNLKAPYQKLALYYVPRVRPASNNNTFEGWPEEFTIYYTNTPDDEESWKRGVSFGEGDIVADLHELRQNYLPFYINESAQYVRVVCTKGYAWKNGHKFWMAGEMNFCTYEADVIYDDGFSTFDKANAQGNGCGDALVAAVAHADEVVANKAITAAELEALKAALEAFKANYTDFTKMKQLITDARELLKAWPEGGENPGQKPQSAIDALRTAQVKANDWFAANKKACTKAELTAAENEIEAAIETFNNTPVATINTNTWYYLVFPSSRTLNGWGYYDKGTEMKDSRLAAAFGDNELIEAWGEGWVYENGTKTVPAPTDDDPEATTEVKISYRSNMAGGVLPANFEDVEEDAMMWRFVQLAEGKYAIQNRMTGNFVPVVDRSNFVSNVGLEPMPGAFEVNHLGDGSFEFKAYSHSTINEETKEKSEHYGYINLYNTNAQLGFWQQTGKTDAGAKWKIEIAEPITDYVPYVPELILGVDGLQPNGLILPYDIEIPAKDVAIFYSGVQTVDKENGAVKLVALEGTKIAAGTPFIVYDKDADAEPSMDNSQNVTVEITSAVNKIAYNVEANNWETPAVAGALQGTMVRNKVLAAGAGRLTYDEADEDAEDYVENFFGGPIGAIEVVAEDANGNLPHIKAGKLWINVTEDLYGTLTDDETDLVILGVAADLQDGIAVVNTKTGKTTVYNLNGQRVSKPAKGLYIVNGQKVVVK